MKAKDAMERFNVDTLEKRGEAGKSNRCGAQFW